MSIHTNMFSLSEDFIISTQDIGIEPTQSIGSFLFTNLKEHEDYIAQIDPKSGEQGTSKKLLVRSVRAALHMLDKNVTPKDVITLCTQNHINALVPYLAAQFLGVKLGNIDPSHTPQEMRHALKVLQPRMIFATPRSVSTLEKVLEDIMVKSEIVVFGRTSKHTDFSDFLKPHPQEEKFEPVKVENLNETAFICFSSGTEGLPKAICLSHYSLMGQTINMTFTDNPDVEYLQSILEKLPIPMSIPNFSSLCWLTGTASLMLCVNGGYCSLICQEFGGREIWDLIQKYKPFFLTLTPIKVIELLANRRTDVNIECVLFIMVLGSKMSRAYLQRLQEVFPEASLVGMYGQAESGGIATMFLLNDKHHRQLCTRPEKLESMGLPLRGTSYRVVDLETGKNVGPNKHGELYLKSKFVMNGYYNGDCSDIFDENGWLKTGDVVYYDEDFCFYFVERTREAFKYHGWFITPSLIEDVFMQHPAVKLAVVIGIPKDDGCYAMGLVVLNDGFEVTEEEIEKFVNERVSEKERLRSGVRFITSVPLTITGKVKRRELKQMFLGGKL